MMVIFKFGKKVRANEYDTFTFGKSIQLEDRDRNGINYTFNRIVVSFAQ